MKNIKITFEVDGNALTRQYSGYESLDELNWDEIINSMLDTIEKSNDPMKWKNYWPYLTGQR